MVMTSNRPRGADPAVMSHSETQFAGLTIRNSNSKMKSIQNFYSKMIESREGFGKQDMHRTAIQKHWTTTRRRSLGSIQRAFNSIQKASDRMQNGMTRGALHCHTGDSSKSRLAASLTYSHCATILRIPDGCTSRATGQQPKCIRQHRRSIAFASSEQPF